MQGWKPTLFTYRTCPNVKYMYLFMQGKDLFHFVLIAGQPLKEPVVQRGKLSVVEVDELHSFSLFSFVSETVCSEYVSTSQSVACTHCQSALIQLWCELNLLLSYTLDYASTLPHLPM